VPGEAQVHLDRYLYRWGKNAPRREPRTTLLGVLTVAWPLSLTFRTTQRQIRKADSSRSPKHRPQEHLDVRVRRTSPPNAADVSKQRERLSALVLAPSSAISHDIGGRQPQDGRFCMRPDPSFSPLGLAQPYGEQYQ